MIPPKLPLEMLLRFTVGLIGWNHDADPMSRTPFVSATRVVPFFVSGTGRPIAWIRVAGIGGDLPHEAEIAWEWRGLADEIEKARLEGGVADFTASPWAILNCIDASLQ